MTPIERASRALEKWTERHNITGPDELRKYIALEIEEAVSVERESCARIAEQTGGSVMTSVVAIEIRARSEG